MIGLALIFGTFWQMLRLNRLERANPMPADVYAALNPSGWQLADLLFNTKTGELWAGLGYILKGFAALFLWLFERVKRATAEKDPLRFSHYKVFDGWFPKEQKEGCGMRESVEDFEVKSGGFAVAFGANGLEYSGTETRAAATARKEAAKQVEITPKERQILTNYNPPLHNLTLAKQVKAYWQEGKSDYEIAALTGYAQATVKHYRLCFERALNETQPLPSSPVGEG